MEAIRTTGLKKRYGATTALDGLNLSIEQGELVSLLGINGAGKTTTVKLLSCLSRPTAGEAYVHGKSILRESSAVKAMIGVSPQETAVASGLTVEENLELMGGMYGLTKEETKERIEELSHFLSLEEVTKRKAGKLSGGWKRRLSIAMAMINRPQVLFLDEPTLGLDVLARRELWDRIRSLKGKTTVVLTTHYMEEAQELSDRIAILKEGRLLLCDTAEAICRRAGTETLEEAFVRIVKEARE